VGCEATRMRWKKSNDCLRVYTSPPPAAEPLLKEKPLKVASKPYASQLPFKVPVAVLDEEFYRLKPISP